MPEPATGLPVRRRRRSQRRRAKRLARRLRRILGGVALVLLACGAVLAAASWQHARAAERTLGELRGQLQAMAANTEALQTPDGRASAVTQLDAASTTVSEVSRDVHRALPLRILHWIPVAGYQRDGLVQLVDDIGAGITVSRRLIGQVNGLSTTAKITAGTLPVAALGPLARNVDNASRETSHLVRPAGSLWGPLGSNRRQFNDLIGKAATRLTNVAAALDGAQRFLGSGQHRYFLALQNNAEMRDQGMVLSYAEVTFDNGAIQFGRHGSVDNIELTQAASTPIPAGTASVFGYIHPTQTWQSVNPGADFAWSAHAMSDMYQKASGFASDGVIALDVPALAALLQVTGPLQVPGIATQLTATNAPTVLLHDLYANFGPSLAQQTARHERLDEVATALITRIRQGSFDPLALASALGKQAAGSHLKVWTRDVQAERSFEQVGLAGGAAVTDADRTFHLSVENAASNKLDYYLQVAMTQEVTITPGGDAFVVSNVVLRNDSPVGAQPSLQAGPDAYKTTAHPGDYLGWVLLWGPRGSDPANTLEGGLNLSETFLLVPAGQSQTARFVTVIHGAVRNGRFTLRYVPQPRLTPESLTVTVQDASSAAARQWSGALDHTVVLDWPVTKH